MNTEQSYVGGGSYASTPTPEVKNDHQTPSTADHRPVQSGIRFDPKNPFTLTFSMAFGDMLHNPIALNRLRQDLRSWLVAYMPKYENSYNPNDLEQSITHFEILDEFLSALIEEGINELREGQSHV